jgi:hypothetical protein
MLRPANPAPLLCALAAALAVAAPAAGTPAPSNFSAQVDNPWFPLRPGTTLVYRGLDNGLASREVVTVTHTVKLIEGVPCRAVSDRVWLDGHLRERTTDWYSQDRAGNVWYFGEATAELDASGRVTTTSGSWLAGREGGQEGLYMPAHPKPGQSGRQEYLRGEAEDHFRVLDVHAEAAVPAVKTHAALLTEEWSPLEPGVLERKLFVRGIGIVHEQTVSGGTDRNSLVSVRHTS